MAFNKIIFTSLWNLYSGACLFNHSVGYVDNANVVEHLTIQIASTFFFGKTFSIEECTTLESNIPELN